MQILMQKAELLKVSLNNDVGGGGLAMNFLWGMPSILLLSIASGPDPRSLMIAPLDLSLDLNEKIAVQKAKKMSIYYITKVIDGRIVIFYKFYWTV